jgi:3-hydroxybutyryl-CoA dehydratase
MSQAEAFETDFWKDANLRKVWDDIVPGEPRKTIPYTLTKEAIELYCKSVGEDHPIYFDEAYARTTRYGGLIAPPSIHILLMFSCTPADDWMRSPGTVNAGQSWSYNIPARPNESSPCRPARSTSSSSASGCSWCTTTSSSTSVAM